MTENQIDVESTAEAIADMAVRMRQAAQELDDIAERTRKNGNFHAVDQAVSCVANLMPNLQLNRLIIRPLRQFGAV